MKNRIKELRAKYNLTQLDLAKRVDVRRETIVFLEKGKYNPSLKLAHDIAQVFVLKIEEVFCFEYIGEEDARVKSDKMLEYRQL